MYWTMYVGPNVTGDSILLWALSGATYLTLGKGEHLKGAAA